MNTLDNIDDSYFDKIKQIINEETGILIKSENNFDFEIAVRGRIISNKKNPDEYLKFLRYDSKEIINLASVFTIQESNFYRNKDHFDRFKTEILPRLLLENKDEKKITIISAGCATGEEPYTIAMILDDFYYHFDNWDITIIALDINKKALKYADKGIYTKYKLRNLDNYYIEKYFKQIKKRGLQLFSIDNKLKDMINFTQFNLIKEPSMLLNFSNVDIVFCENVIIYFNIDSIQRLINNFYKILKENGYLFLGYTEILNIINHNFSLEWWNKSFAYKKINTDSDGNIKKKQYPKIQNKSNINIKQYKSDTLDYELYIQKAIQYLKKDLYDKVAQLIDDIEKAEIILKEDFYIIKAEYLLLIEDYMSSAHACRNIISINPFNLDAHLILSEIYLNLNMPDNALFEIKTCIHINDTCLISYYYYYKYYQIQNNQKKSLELLNYAVELAKNPDVIFNCNLYPLSKKKQKLIKKTLNC